LIIASWNEHKAASAFNPALAASESQFPGRRSNNVDIRAASARLFLQASLSVALNLMTKRERKEEGERERERSIGQRPGQRYCADRQIVIWRRVRHKLENASPPRQLILTELLRSQASRLCRLPNGHINFEKFWQLAKQVTEFIAWKQVACPFEKNPRVIAFLQASPVLTENSKRYPFRARCVGKTCGKTRATHLARIPRSVIFFPPFLFCSTCAGVLRVRAARQQSGEGTL